MEVDTSDDGEESANGDAVTEEIVHQTIAAERAQDTLDTRVLRDFDDGIITFGRDGIIRYINPSASLILGLTENTVGKPYQELFGKENESLWELLAQATEEKETSHRGDVLYRRKDGSFVLHRVIDFQRDGSYVLCGDNQFYRERGIKDSDVIAVVTAFYRKGKPYTTNSFLYRAYINFWYYTRPFRRVYKFGKRKTFSFLGVKPKEKKDKKKNEE